MAHTKRQHRGSDNSANRCTSQRPDAPTSGGDPPPIEYADLFGLDTDDDRGQSPPSPPPLNTAVSEAERSVYEAAFRVAYEHPNGLMRVLILVRKGLQRGKEAAQQQGHS